MLMEILHAIVRSSSNHEEREREREILYFLNEFQEISKSCQFVHRSCNITCC